MAKNKIEDLRNHLFETIEMLKDDESAMTIEKAEAIAKVAQVIINGEKLVVDYIRTIDQVNGMYPASGFIAIESKNQLTK